MDHPNKSFYTYSIYSEYHTKDTILSEETKYTWFMLEKGDAEKGQKSTEFFTT